MDWALLLAALVFVESGGNSWAYNKHDGAVGSLQIRQICLTDVNRKQGTSYQLQELFGNEELSRWVCMQYLRTHGATDYESAARLWCAGPRWRNSKHKSDAYWNKVQSRLSQLSLNKNYENSSARRWGMGKRAGESP